MLMDQTGCEPHLCSWGGVLVPPGWEGGFPGEEGNVVTSRVGRAAKDASDDQAPSANADP
jgi:hypothetical protein